MPGGGGGGGGALPHSLIIAPHLSSEDCVLSFPAGLRTLSALQRDAERSLMSGPHSGSDLGCCLTAAFPAGTPCGRAPADVTWHMGLCEAFCELSTGILYGVVCGCYYCLTDKGN